MYIPLWYQMKTLLNVVHGGNLYMAAICEQIHSKQGHVTLTRWKARLAVFGGKPSSYVRFEISNLNLNDSFKKRSHHAWAGTLVEFSL